MNTLPSLNYSAKSAVQLIKIFRHFPDIAIQAKAIKPCGNYNVGKNGYINKLCNGHFYRFDCYKLMLYF